VTYLINIDIGFRFVIIMTLSF